MILVDTHCHLDLLDNPFTAYVKALSMGINQLIIPSVSTEPLKTIIQLAQARTGIYYAVGIYPIEVNIQNDSKIQRDIQKIQEHLENNDNKLVAIGECGLDFSPWDENTYRVNQISLFNQHIKWAIDYKLPLLIHNRKASEDLLNLIKRDPKLTGVFHCFSQKRSIARRILSETNFYLGLGGLITKDYGLMEIVKEIPLERIVLETDAPYLIPKHPACNSEYNEPANILYTAQRLAEIKNVDLNIISKITTDNAKGLFTI